MGRNTLKLNFNGVNQLLMKYAALDDNLKPVTEKALKKAADTITRDVKVAIQKPNLPAAGKYSHGDTEKSVVDNPAVKWSGLTAEVGLGFDFNKPGAGGYLIKGRHKPTHMNRAEKLNMIFTGKGYIKRVREEMEQTVEDEIRKAMKNG